MNFCELSNKYGPLVEQDFRSQDSVSVAASGHDCPSGDGLGLLQRRLRVRDPVPQVTEQMLHDDQSLQAPSTGDNCNTLLGLRLQWSFFDLKASSSVIYLTKYDRSVLLLSHSCFIAGASCFDLFRKFKFESINAPTIWSNNSAHAELGLKKIWC